jgi:hypothetical protein
MTDHLAGESHTLPGDYILNGAPGDNQLLGVPQHDAPEVVEIVAGEGSRIQAGQLPQVTGPAFGPPSKANPLGNAFNESLNQ